MGAPHENGSDTPVMRQFLEIKGRYPDALLFFRMGDFYEMFFEDAIRAGSLLDIAVTSRDKNAEDPVPMAGVPYHAVGGYLRTLVERGVKVAICEQMETPEEARKRRGSKIVHREVVRVVTPGALVDEEHLPPGEANYLCALVPGDDGACGVSALDISSGEFFAIDVGDEDALRAELSRLRPREVLAPEPMHPWLRDGFGEAGPSLEARTEEGLDAALVARVRALVGESTGQSLGALAEKSAALALAYAEATQPGQTLLLHRLRVHEPSRHVALDDSSLRNLEVFRTLRDGKRRGSLLWAVDGTKTAMGARKLQEWLGAPLRDRAAIADRQEGIEALLGDPGLRERIQSRLKDVRDVVRLTARARLRTANPRELASLRTSLAALPNLAGDLAELRTRRTDRAVPTVLDLGDDLLDDLLAALAQGLVDEPPAHLRDGGVIRDGADAFLDKQRALRDGGRDALAAIETRERETTGIHNLKVQHNRVFGYFLEVPKGQAAKVPKHYVRKQTLANAERFVTEELAGHETKVLGAQAQALVREQELFNELRGQVSDAGERLCALSERLAAIDVIAGWAAIAQRHDYVAPTMVEDPVLELVGARHPVVERMLDAGRFVPNDIRLSAHHRDNDPRFWVLTGPNMGGKSTIMRQTALIALLAHAGAYVPASAATVGMVDRIFTRVGAADDLGRGDSTFMVEMRETAQILRHASASSLVLLDEIGRGTATYDGLALAWAITEFIHDQIGCRSIFATHYHELCALASRLRGVANVHVAVHEQRGRVVFLHQLMPGPAGRSYGVHVGRLAGLPQRVLRRAARILARLEAAEGGDRDQLDLFNPDLASLDLDPDPDTDADVEAEAAAAGPAAHARGAAVGWDGATVHGADNEVLDMLRATQPDDLSPRAAWELLDTLSRKLREPQS